MAREAVSSASPQGLGPPQGELSRKEVQSFLAEETLFRGSSEAALAQLSALAVQNLVQEGCTFFTMDQPCQALHFVAQGSGLLVRVSGQGRQLVLHQALPGDMVGCVPFFDGKGYPANFVAETDCLMISLPRDKLLELFAANPGVSLSLVGALSSRLRLSPKPAEARVCRER